MKPAITFFLFLSAWNLSDLVRGDDKGPAPAGSSTSPVKIAVVDSFFRDIPEPLVRPVVEPLRVLMMAQTGMDGDVVLPKDALHLAQDLADGKIQLGLFHGFEFAWAQYEHPNLRPLMIAINHQRQLQVLVMIRSDSPLKSFADLNGKAVGLPCFCQEHCWICMERSCQAVGQADPKRFFSSFTTPRDPEEGLDQLADGKIEAVIVDNVALDSYQKRKPARFAKLKCLQKSEGFPSAVIAYREGDFDAATIKRFQDGLMEGQKTGLGRQLLMLWKLSSIERVPSDFNESLEKILKAYPPPSKQRAGKEKPTDLQTATRRP
jgi:ABC-type phosphate/phosphonate transport system substrate-binding protein